MNSILKIAILVNIVSESLADDYVLNNRRFPTEFMFGVGSSAYQSEGAWNKDGKSASIWDNATHVLPELVLDRSNADIACDSYNKYEEDIAILKEMGVNHYRFSLAWTRILPNGFSDQINQLGVTYYKNLLRDLKANGIEPFVTIYHWDLPLALQELNGLLNDSFIDWYADYAAVCFELFGDDVKFWATFNEPHQICNGGFGYGFFAPFVQSEGLLEYQCGHNLLRAHARAYRLYEEKFKATQGGRIGISLDTTSFLPGSESDDNVTAVKTLYDFEMGWFANPVYHGDYPETMKSRVATRSLREGRNKSRLPEFTEAEKASLKGTADFFSVNTYTSALAIAVEDPPISDPPTRYQDIGVLDYQPPEWETGEAGTKIAPWSVRYTLNWIHNHYDQPDIIVTENGYSDSTGNLQDKRRISYIQSYLSYIRDTIEEDGVNVIGYTVWSFLDDFEFTLGYSHKLGIYHVDFTSPNRTRTPKLSAQYFKNVSRTRCLLDDDDDCIN